VEALAEHLGCDCVEAGFLGAHELREVEKLDPLAERFGVEERERVEMADELLVRLRPGREVEGAALNAGVREADLLREDRLPAAGRARDDDERPRRKAAAENDVEPLGTGRQAFHQRPLASSASAVSASFTGSNGFRMKMSALVLRSEPGLELMRMI